MKNWIWILMHIAAMAGVGKVAWTIIPAIWADWPGETVVVICALAVFSLEIVVGLLSLFAEILERKIADLDKAKTARKKR